MLSGFRPPLFLLTALLWLLLSILLGLFVWIAGAIGWAVPPQLRVMHVHMALVGGVAQMIFGAMLAFIPALLMVPFKETKGRAFQYILLNGGTLGMVAGFAIGDFPVVGFSGAAVGIVFLILLSDTLHLVRQSVQRTGLNLWFYGLAVLSLLGGIGLGEMVAFGGLSSETIGLARLAHLHLNLIGFIMLTIVGTMHNLFPTVANSRLYSDRLAMATFFTLPLGVVGLVSGFIVAEPLFQVAAGFVLLLGVCCYGWNIYRTWLGAGTRYSLPVLHLLCTTAWLVPTVAAGILIAWNSRTDPPAFPIGTAHLMGYSHMALVGFILQTIMGALCHLLPVILALNRAKSQKKRRPYLETLTGLIEQGKWPQLFLLNLGTAVMMWWGLSSGIFGLRAIPTLSALWAAAGLLVLGIGLFVVKLGRLFALQPQKDQEGD
jgi:hypothetical protein